MVNVAKICNVNVIHGLKPVLLMVAVQTAFAGVNVFYKLAANDGMVLSILIAYRFLFSVTFIVPLAFLVERKKRPKMTWMILLQAFCCGLFGGSLVQNFYIKALSLTSATFAAATTNLIPAITVLAVCFRMERLGWKTSSGVAKIIGTALGIGGAMLLTFYKGVDLHLWKTNINLLNGQHHLSNAQHSSNRLLGSILAIGSCISYSIWLILQTSRFTELEEPSELKKSTELKETELIMSSEQAMLILPAVAHFRQVFSEPVQSPVVTLLQWQHPPVTNSDNPPVKMSSSLLQMTAPDECSSDQH